MRRFWLRLRRFFQRRGLVLVCCVAAIVGLEQVHFSDRWNTEFRGLYAALGAFLFGNEFRLAWILGKRRALRPVDWTYHWELGISFVVVGFSAGARYPCLCTSLSGELILKNYLEVAALFGTPLLIATIFLIVRRTRFAMTLSASLITALWALYPWYTEWIH